MVPRFSYLDYEKNIDKCFVCFFAIVEGLPHFRTNKSLYDLFCWSLTADPFISYIWDSNQMKTFFRDGNAYTKIFPKWNIKFTFMAKHVCIAIFSIGNRCGGTAKKKRLQKFQRIFDQSYVKNENNILEKKLPIFLYCPSFQLFQITLAVCWFCFAFYIHISPFKWSRQVCTFVLWVVFINKFS